MGQNILVTGGAGYIGSHTCKLLASKGYTPICYDNLSTGHKDFVKWGPLEIGDLHDTINLIKVLNKYKPIAVIHFAASAYVGESVNNPLKYFKNNVGGTLSLLDAMDNVNIRSIVFSSTCATYGVPNTKIITEETPQNPINPYGQSKLMVEKILDALARQEKISQISLRYFNAAGADKNGEIGERHIPETHLIPLAIDSALHGTKLKIFGTDYETHDGSAVRDYVHVEDLAQAHIKAIEYVIAKQISDFFNIGSETGTSVFEVIKTIEKLGYCVKKEETKRRIGDPAHLVANANKIKKILKWKPVYNQIEDTIKTAINWHSKNV